MTKLRKGFEEGFAETLLGRVVFYIWDGPFLHEEFHHSEWHIRAAKVQTVIYSSNGFYGIIADNGDIVFDWHIKEETALKELQNMIAND